MPYAICHLTDAMSSEAGEARPSPPQLTPSSSPLASSPTPPSSSSSPSYAHSPSPTPARLLSSLGAPPRLPLLQYQRMLLVVRYRQIRHRRHIHLLSRCDTCISSLPGRRPHRVVCPGRNGRPRMRCEMSLRVLGSVFACRLLGLLAASSLCSRGLLVAVPVLLLELEMRCVCLCSHFLLASCR